MVAAELTLEIKELPTPLRIDESGAVRVGKTRVTLETVLTAYKMGRTPEQIVKSFPTLQLADVHATIAYYLLHKEEVDKYLDVVKRLGKEIQTIIEAGGDPKDISRKIRQLKKGSKSCGGS